MHKKEVLKKMSSMHQKYQYLYLVYGKQSNLRLHKN
jgi:hypothetical protein